MNSIQLYRELQAHSQKMSEITTQLYHAGLDTADARAEVEVEMQRFNAKLHPAEPSKSAVA